MVRNNPIPPVQEVEESDEEDEDYEEEQEQKQPVKKQIPVKQVIVEREVTLSLINDKLNYIIAAIQAGQN